MTKTKYEPRDDEIFLTWTDRDGKVNNTVDEDLIVAKLIIDQVLFVNCRRYITDPKGENLSSVSKNNTIVAFVNCNDTFGGGGDAECVSTDELEELYRFHLANTIWGSTKWVCKKRNSQPWWRVIDRMKENGVWDDMMENLPKMV